MEAVMESRRLEAAKDRERLLIRKILCEIYPNDVKGKSMEVWSRVGHIVSMLERVEACVQELSPREIITASTSPKVRSQIARLARIAGSLKLLEDEISKRGLRSNKWQTTTIGESGDKKEEDRYQIFKKGGWSNGDRTFSNLGPFSEEQFRQQATTLLMQEIRAMIFLLQAASCHSNSRICG